MEEKISYRFKDWSTKAISNLLTKLYLSYKSEKPFDPHERGLASQINSVKDIENLAGEVYEKEKNRAKKLYDSFINGMCKFLKG